MSKLTVLIIFLALLGTFQFLLEVCISDYDRCYLDKEDEGYAVFENCAGIKDGTGRLSGRCADCPYLASWVKEEDCDES